MLTAYDQLMPQDPTQAVGTPGYESNVVGTAAGVLKPQLQQAIAAARGNLANRGLDRGGLALASDQGLGQNYNNDLSTIAGNAAEHGANLDWQKQMALEKQGWEQNNINNALAQRRHEFNTNQENENNAQLMDLGGSLGVAGGGGLASLMMKQGMKPQAQPNPGDTYDSSWS